MAVRRIEYLLREGSSSATVFPGVSMFRWIRSFLRLQRRYWKVGRLRRQGRLAAARVICLEMLRSVESNEDPIIPAAYTFGVRELCRLSDETGIFEGEAVEIRRLRSMLLAGSRKDAASSLDPRLREHEDWLDERLRWLDARAAGATAERDGAMRTLH